MSNYNIIAICGKSASGKDTLANFLARVLTIKNINNHIIISNTTRPPREKEVSGIDYNFIDESQFFEDIKSDKMFEWTCFRGWYYGIPYTSLKTDVWNIGVFNADGIKSLINWEKTNKDDTINIVYIYLYVNAFTRLRRSYKREHKWKAEYIRRLIVDTKDFFKFKYLINKQKYGIIIKNKVNSYMFIIDQIISNMREWHLI